MPVWDICPTPNGFLPGQAALRSLGLEPMPPPMLSRSLLLAGLLAASASSLGAQTLTTIRFDSLTPTVTGGGSITYRGTSQSVVSVGTVSSFGLAAMAGGGNPVVMSIPAFAPTQGFRFTTGASTGNGGGIYINRYTMVYDVYWAASPAWFAFFNSDSPNLNDADFFRRGSSGGLGIGTYFGNAPIGQWQRVAFTVTNISATQTTVGIYLNGSFLGNSTLSGGTDGRFSLYTSGSANQTVLFSDNNNETGAAYVAQFMFADRVYSAGEVATLGGASFTPFIPVAIPEPGTYGLLAGAFSLALGYLRQRRRQAVSG
jgi:hypothetical protein